MAAAAVFACGTLLIIVDPAPSGSERAAASQVEAKETRVDRQEPAPNAASPTVDHDGAPEPESNPVARRSVLSKVMRRGYAARPKASPQRVAVDEVEAHESLRASVISAVRRRDLSPAARHETLVQTLEESGPSSASWTRPSPEVFSAWKASLPSEFAAGIGKARCYRAGCLLPVSFQTAEAYEAAAEAFRSIHDPELPHGGRVLLPPKTNADGDVETGWLMLPPPPARS